MKKTEVLSKGAELIAGQREDDYGDAAKNFGDISRLWSVVLGTEVAPWQVAACLTQLKLARAIKTPDHEDSWVDMAGYVGLAGELATETSEVKPCLKVGDFATTEAEYAALPVGSMVDVIGCGYEVGDTIEGRDAYNNAPKGLVVESKLLQRKYTSLGNGHWRDSKGSFHFEPGEIYSPRTVVKVP